MDLLDYSAIIVAIIAALGAWLAQRAASKASKLNKMVSIRLEAEREAYERARAFDVQTIKHQNEEIDRLRALNQKIGQELASVKRRLSKLEEMFPEWERLLNERLEELDDT